MMARASQDFQQFGMNAQIDTNLPNVPMDDGSAAQAAAATFSKLGGILGNIADKAAAKAGYAAGQKQAEGAIPLPEIVSKTKTTKGQAVAGPSAANMSLRDGIIQTAKALGVDPQHIATAISYETGGTFDPAKRGPHTQYGQHRGLIQFGEPQAQKYGVDWNNPIGSQLGADGAVTRYLQDAGVKPGMGMLDIYSAINAGRVGRYNASDANNGGAPGTVRDKVMGQMQAHAVNAQRLLGGSLSPGAQSPVNAAMAGPLGDVTTTTLTYNVPMPKPLALRNDGTISGDSYDKAIAETAGWRLTAGLDAAMTNAHAENSDNPEAFAKAMNQVGKDYLKQAEGYGPDVKTMIAQRAMRNAESFVSDVNAKKERMAEETRQAAAGASIDAETNLIERQAYALGTTKDGDQQLAALSQSALGRISQAEASGAITPVQAAKARTNTLETLTISRMKGVFDALPSPEEKKHFVSGLMDEWKVDNSPLSAISLDKMQSIVNNLDNEAGQQQRAKNATNAFDKAKFERLVKDDVASMHTTGKGLNIADQPMDFATVSKNLGEPAALDWLQNRDDANATFQASHGLEQMTVNTMDQRLKELEPQPGEVGFAAKEKAYNVALKRSAEIIKQRTQDPAQAAEDAFPQLAKEKDPFIRAQKRIDAQAALGIEGLAQNPLTKAEAQTLSSRINLVEDNPDALDSEMRAIMNDAQKTYGTLADDVMVQVMGETGVRKQTAQAAIGMMNELNIGRVPDQQMIQNYSAYRRADLAHAAMDGAAPPARVQTPQPTAGRGGNRNPQQSSRKSELPNAAHISMLKGNPALATQFDQRFGKGSAETFLGDHGEPIRRKLANGDTELQYADGFVETYHADGTIDGRAAQ